MLNLKPLIKLAALTGGLCALSLAQAHVSITNTLYANSYSQIELTIPHGCEGFDTVKVEVSIPEGLPGVRALDSLFGPATLESDDEGKVTKITWTGSGPLYPTDDHAYSLAFRTKTPDAPYSTLYFPAVQTCEDPDGNTYESAWVGTSGGHDHGSESDQLPAPSAMLYPKATPGWHQFTANDHMHDMSIFDNAEIVWKGEAAYSPNNHTMQMIQDDDSVSVLSEIHPGDVFWVKY